MDAATRKISRWWKTATCTRRRDQVEHVSATTEFEQDDVLVKVHAYEAVEDDAPNDPLRLVNIYLEDLGSLAAQPTTIIAGQFRLEPPAARRLASLIRQHADMLDGGER